MQFIRERIIFEHDGYGMNLYSLIAAQELDGSVQLIQSFPSFYLGHATERACIRLEDIDAVIEFLQEAKRFQG